MYPKYWNLDISKNVLSKIGLFFFVEQIKIRMKQLLLYQNSIFETPQYRKQIQNFPKFVKEKTLIFTY